MRLTLLLVLSLTAWIAAGPRATAQSDLPTGVDLRAGINSVGYLGETLPVLDALGGAAGAVTQIWRYDRFAAPGASPWSSWSPALPEALQGFRALTFGEAYFVVADAPVRWDFPQDALPPLPASVRLVAGGNHIVYLGPTQAVEGAIGLSAAELRAAQIELPPDLIDNIQRLDADGWKAWSARLPAALRGFDQLDHGQAYFVTATGAAEWNFGLASQDDAIRLLLGDVLSPADLDALLGSAQAARTRHYPVEPPNPEFERLYWAAVDAFASPPEGLDIQTDREYQLFLGVTDRPLESDPLSAFAAFTTGVLDPNGRLFDPDQPRNAPADPFTGIGHSVNVFTDSLDGWQLAQSTDPLNGGPRETGAFSYAAAGEPFVFFAVPTDELPALPLLNLGVGQRDADAATGDSFFDVFVGVSVAARFPDLLDPGDFFNLTPAQPAEGPQANHTCQMVHSTTFGRLYDLVCGAGRFLVDATARRADGGEFLPPLNTTQEGFGIFDFGAGQDLLVRVVNGCSFSGHFWVFAASTTSVEFTLTVTDTLSGAVQDFHSPPSIVPAPILDTSAFATCP